MRAQRDEIHSASVGASGSYANILSSPLILTMTIFNQRGTRRFLKSPSARRLRGVSSSSSAQHHPGTTDLHRRLPSIQGTRRPPLSSSNSHLLLQLLVLRPRPGNLADSAVATEAWASAHSFLHLVDPGPPRSAEPDRKKAATDTIVRPFSRVSRTICSPDSSEYLILAMNSPLTGCGRKLSPSPEHPAHSRQLRDPFERAPHRP